jgi:diguanylate cyclase (GGDEF)-like protein
VRLPSLHVLKRTAIIAIIAACASISLSICIRYFTGTRSDTVTMIARFALPFMVAIPIGIFWFSRLERLEESYRHAVKRANELARVANVDPLTGALNRRSFIEHFKIATSAGVKGWFLIADIDYLKNINDQYGHPVGDDAVIAVAQALVRKLPLESLIARIGGDEFCAFVPKAACNNIDDIITQISHEADILLRKKRSNIEQLLSVSIGYITVRPGQSFEDVMSLSDERLYRKKSERLFKENMSA